MKTLFVAAGLCVGQSVWGEKITYDFTTITESSLTKSANHAGYAFGAMTWDLYYPTELPSVLNNIFAFQYRVDGTNVNQVSVDHSRGGLFVWHKAGKDEVFAITNLQAGDIVKVTLVSGSCSFYGKFINATYDNAGTETTPTSGDSFVSDRLYKVKGDGAITLTTAKNSGNFVISKIVIDRPYARVWSMDLQKLARDIQGSFLVKDVAWQIRYNGTNKSEVGLWPYNLSSNRTMAIRNLTKGQFVVFWASAAVTAGTNAIKVDDWSGDNYYTFQVTGNGVASFEPTNSSYIYSVGVYDHNNEIVGAMDKSSGYRTWLGGDIVIANGSAKKVTFKNYGSGSGDEFYKNWVLDINYGGALVTTLRSDWYAFGVGAFTYGYTYSSNAGSTADNTNVWGSWFTDMNGSEAELTLSHVGGKLYVIGTVSKGNKVYYMNYTYGDGSQTEDFTLNLSVDHSFIEMVSTEGATPTTTPAHPTAISAGNVGTTGYSTFASTLYPLDLSGISGAEVYYAEAVNGSTVKFKSTDASVPAGEGLLLKGTAGDAVTINIADAGTAISGNLLKGCTAETVVASDADKYVLVNKGGTAEFQNLSKQGATIPAGKAYLDATGAGARSLTIVFDDDDVTGVNEVRSQKEDVRSEWFDLQGRKVAQPAKGLYIVNGKKVVIK